MKKKVNKNNLCKEFLYFIVFFILLISIISSFVVTFVGITDADKCNTPLSRIEYVFPFYRLGCWLGEVPEEKTCNN